MRMWAQRAVAFLFAVILVWGLYHHAGRELQVLYRLFIFLIIPSIIAAIWLHVGWLLKARFVCLLLVGVFVLAQIFFQPTVWGRGYVVLAIGWLALYLSLSMTLGRPQTLRVLFMFLIVLGGAEALSGLSQSLGTGSLAKGTFTNRNHFSGFLNMIIPLAIGGLYASYAGLKDRLRSETYAQAWIILLSCAFMGLGVLLSLSRGGTISLILTLLVIALLLTINRQRSRSGKLPATVIWVLVFSVLALGIWVGMDVLIVRFAAIDEIGSGRLIVYRDTLKLIWDHALVGVGPGMYQWRFRPYQTVDATNWWTQAHNDYLQSAAEWGIFLALLFWGFVIWRFLRSIRLFLRAEDPWKQGIGLGCAGAIFSILVHSGMDFNLQIPGNWMIFCTILGLSWSTDWEANENQEQVSSSSHL